MKIEKTFSVAPEKTQGLSAKQDQQLKDAAKMYEQHFMNEMVKAMRSTVHHDDSFIKKNFAEKIFEEQMDQKYTEAWTQRGGVGLQDMIYNQIKDRYFSKSIPRPMGPLPIPKTQPIPVPKDEGIKIQPTEAGPNAQMQYLMEGTPSDPITAPWDGTITELEKMDQGWSKIKLDHSEVGQGLSSLMTFQGQAQDLALGDRVGAGQRLGKLSLERPVLAWKLDWS